MSFYIMLPTLHVIHTSPSYHPHSRVTKMVFSSSLMEASFFTIAQRKELFKVVEEEERLTQIEELNKVGTEAEVL